MEDGNSDIGREVRAAVKETSWSLLKAFNYTHGVSKLSVACSNVANYV